MIGQVVCGTCLVRPMHDTTTSTARPWWHRVGRAALVAVLLTYLGILFLGSLPSGITDGGVEKLSKRIRAGFWKVRVRPGAPVFSGRGKYNWVVHHWCLTVFEVDDSGETRLVRSTTPNCMRPHLRGFTDVEELALYSAIGRNTASRLATSRKHFRNVEQIRRSRGVKGVTRYFCAQAAEDVALVVLAAQTESVKYKTGGVRGTFDVIGSFDCRKDRTAPVLHRARFDTNGVPELVSSSVAEQRARQNFLMGRRKWR